MNEPGCERVRDMLPEFLHGALEPGLRQEVETHLPACGGCREELTLLETLLAARPEAPSGLESRIQARLRDDLSTEAPRVIPLFRRRPMVPTWGLSAAAVLILALGIGVLWNPGVREVGVQTMQVAVAEEPLPEAWLWDDGVVAGAPVFDGLSDEDLEALLAALEEGA